MNLVYHQNEQLCEYKQPEAQFFVFVNRDTSRLLFENAPRWSSAQDENISGKGCFGVELGNFTVPAIQMGDTIHVVFTCQATEEQLTASDPVTGIPWYRWPLHLIMKPQDFPKIPQDFSLPEKVAYEFMDICDFNVAYWRGDQREAEYQLNIKKWVHLPETGLETESKFEATFFYSLEQNFPNPFNASTEIAFSLQNPGETTFSVFNITGQHVCKLVDRHLPAGPHRMKWNPNLPSGTYFVRLQSENFTQLRKIILIR